MRIFSIVRLSAWTLGTAALLAVCLRYASLPEEIPVTRWVSAPKSWLLALRAPLINLISLGLVELLNRSFFRLSQDWKTRTAAAVLLLTAGLKSATEGVEILRLPEQNPLLPLLLISTIVSGLSVAAYLLMPILRNGNWKRLPAAPSEKAALALLVLGIIALNFPLFGK